MTAGIIICHGNLAIEFVNSVQKIAGKTEQFFPFSNNDQSPESLKNAVKSTIEKSIDTKNESIIIFSDLRGGSCWRVAKMLAHDFSGIKVVSGVNIPMLLSFLSKRERLPVDDLIKILETDSHKSIIFE